MATRGGAVHVVTTRRIYKAKVYETHLLRRSYRDGDKVKNETLGNLSHLPGDVIDLIRRSLKGEVFTSATEGLVITRSRPHGHVAAVLGTMRRLGLAGLIAPTRSSERDAVEAMVAMRIIEPRSKLATVRALRHETLQNSLGELLGLAECTDDSLYDAMDWLVERQDKIEDALAKRHLSDGTLTLYDLSSTYFEGRHCPLARLGHSRDGKSGKLQIVFGLLTNSEGCPVAVEVFEGNTGDPKTVAAQVTKLRERFGLERIVLVGDRGMLTSARIREDLVPNGIAWITALRAPAIQKLAREGTLQLSLFDQRDLAEIHSEDFPNERLIACRNPLLAEERARKRLELLAATEKELAKIRAATLRSKRPLRGEAAIGLRVGRVIGRYKMAKHFVLTIGKRNFEYERNEENIAEEAALDGIYIIRATGMPKKTASAEDLVVSYKQLSTVERAFRSMKTVDLKVRPVFHRDADRVRAHVFLCMLAYYVEWHMRRALAPLLFDDEEPAEGEARRDSIVAPAQRSEKAERKASRKQNDAGQPVQSFQSLLRDLATVVKNRVRPSTKADAEFEMLTIPTPLQRRAFELLEVSPAM